MSCGLTTAAAGAEAQQLAKTSNELSTGPSSPLVFSADAFTRTVFGRPVSGPSTDMITRLPRAVAVNAQLLLSSVSSLVFPTSGPFEGFEPSIFGPTFTAQTVPEPTTLLLLGGGLVAVARRLRRV